MTAEYREFKLLGKYWPLGFLFLFAFVSFIIIDSERSIKLKIEKNAKELVSMKIPSTITNKIIDSNYRMHMYLILADTKTQKQSKLDITDLRLGARIWYSANIGDTLIKHKYDSVFIFKNNLKRDSFIINLSN